MVIEKGEMLSSAILSDAENRSGLETRFVRFVFFMLQGFSKPGNCEEITRKFMQHFVFSSRKFG